MFSAVISSVHRAEVDLSSQVEMKGLGEIGNPKNRGLFLHCGLAVMPDGVPVGPLSVLTWVRPPEEHGKAMNRNGRVFDAKESAKWWKTIETAERAVKSPGRLVHVGDRESDIFELLARCLATCSRALFRAAQNRKVLDGEHSRLWAEAESWSVTGQRVIDIPAKPARGGKPARAARTALLALRRGSVRIAQPDSKEGFIELSVVLVREVEAPDDGDVIEWLLLGSGRPERAAPVASRTTVARPSHDRRTTVARPSHDRRAIVARLFFAVFRRPP